MRRIPFEPQCHMIPLNRLNRDEAAALPRYFQHRPLFGAEKEVGYTGNRL